MLKFNPPHLHTLSPPFPLLQFTPRPISNAFLRRRPNRNFKVIRGSVREGESLEAEEAELLVTTCVTRTLPPALTLEHGLRKINDAIDELKSNPPRSASGMYRFQVAVPPSPKALDWFCCQPESSVIFPQFFLSTEKGNATFRSLALSGVLGIFGIGAAILFKGSSSCASAGWSSLERYLSIDSSVVTAYGFMDVDFDMESSSMKHLRGSFYLFIPEWRAALHLYTLLK